MIAKEVLNASAALLNDTDLSLFTYTAQIPYLNIALAELQEECELNNVPITNEGKVIITIPAGLEGIGNGNGQPNLPPDFIEPLQLQERVSGALYTFIDMTRVDYVPSNQVPTAFLMYWTYQGETINFPVGGATGNVDVLLRYIKSIFKMITTETDQINMINAKTFLTYRNAGLCAEFIGENKERADDLNGMASLALQRALGISTKGRQAIFTRRRPFMAGWRSRRVI
jgi:hypothetical protein